MSVGGKSGTGADGWLIKTESEGGGYLVISRRVARAMTTWAHASARRWGETWVRSIKIPRFLAVLGGQAFSLRAPGICRGYPWVWSLAF